MKDGGYMLIFISSITMVFANDSWTNIATGVDLLHRVEGGTLPQDIYAVRVDLTNPHISIHASKDAVGSERGVNTLTFANNSGAIAAINGDWGASSSTVPLSLSIGEGQQWNPHTSDANIGSHWGFFGCTIFNECSAGTKIVGSFDFLNPTLSPYRFFNAVGSNGVILVDDGVRAGGCFDSSRNPRSAICVNAAQSELWLIAVDGRRTAASGMTCDETRDLVLDLGCWDASMLDGGGSTTLVADGSIRNTPSDGSPRTRPNHIGVILADSTDPECTVESRRWCNADEINTCSGGRFLGSGDCAFFGATCEEDGDWAYCVHFMCPNGQGDGASCLDATNIASCNDGQYSEGDCAAFGAVCGSDAYGTSCMQAECVNGPNSGFCITENLAAQCQEGIYEEITCSGDSVCQENDGLASCIELTPEPTSEPTAEPTSEPTVEPTSEPTAEPSSPTAEPAEEQDTNEPSENGGKSSCQSSPVAPISWMILLLSVVLLRKKEI